MSRENAQELVQYLSIVKTMVLGYWALISTSSRKSPILPRVARSARSDNGHDVSCILLLGLPLWVWTKAAQGLGLPGEPAGVSGFKAPKFWAQGRYRGSCVCRAGHCEPLQIGGPANNTGLRVDHEQRYKKFECPCRMVGLPGGRPCDCRNQNTAWMSNPLSATAALLPGCQTPDGWGPARSHRTVSEGYLSPFSERGQQNQ